MHKEIMKLSITERDALDRLKNDTGARIYFNLLFAPASYNLLKKLLGSNRNLTQYLELFEKAGFIEYDTEATLNNFKVFVDSHSTFARKRFEAKLKNITALCKKLNEIKAELAKELNKPGKPKNKKIKLLRDELYKFKRLPVKEHFFKATLKPFFIRLDVLISSYFDYFRNIKKYEGDPMNDKSLNSFDLHFYTNKEEEFFVHLWGMRNISLKIDPNELLFFHDLREIINPLEFLHRYFSLTIEQMIKNKESFIVKDYDYTNVANSFLKNYKDPLTFALADIIPKKT